MSGSVELFGPLFSHQSDHQKSRSISLTQTRREIPQSVENIDVLVLHHTMDILLTAFQLNATTARTCLCLLSTVQGEQG